MARSRNKTLLLILVIVPFWTHFIIRIFAWKSILEANGVINSTLVGLGLVADSLQLEHNYATIMIRQGMLEKLDHSKHPNIAYIDPQISAKKVSAPSNDYCVPYFMGAAGIMVNKEKVKNYEKSWKIFDRADLKGKMTLLDDPREVIAGASPRATSGWCTASPRTSGSR